MSTRYTTLDANQAVASVAHRLNEVIAIYPITPASPMGEWADAWSCENRPNIWETVPSIVEMQSEGGAAGAVHGALQTGSLTTTFTASQGLMLMLPNMYKIAGELTSTVFHVAARSLAAQALSIFGDHSDVMAARTTGWALLSSASVQEAQDLAAIAHAATLESRIPVLHFFDGFRTSHEISKIVPLEDNLLRELIDDSLVEAHRGRALTPDRPVLRGTAQNPDVYFQAREAANRFYQACPDIFQNTMDRFAELTGRAYQLYGYHGAPDAQRVIVVMGSACESVHETVDHEVAQGEKVGVLKVRLYRPFDAKRFAEALPRSTKAIAVLDRTKEPGSLGEPLYLDCLAALAEARNNKWEGPSASPKVIGGRYGLSSKEFTPAMIKAIFDELGRDEPKNHFTIGIDDDVTHTSLEYDPTYSIESDEVVRAMFFGLGSDGTVGANKNTIKIIGEETDRWVQGYFVYDSKKAGAVTVSHLRFGPSPIRSSYLIERANVVACHQSQFFEHFEILDHLAQNGTVLWNTSSPVDKAWHELPREAQRQIVEKQAKLFVIDAAKVASECGMGRRINTVMQVCFFAVAGILPRDEAINAVKESIRKTYGKKGEDVVQRNLDAVDQTLEHLFEVQLPSKVDSTWDVHLPVPEVAPAFVRDVIGPIISRRGDLLPVSKLPIDGTFPTGTSQWEKRNLASEIPVWDPDICIQCGKCVMVCPHAVIRSKVYEPTVLEQATPTFKSAGARDRQWHDLKYTIQVAPEDCTGCGICVDVCPVRNKSQARLKAINMEAQRPLREKERDNWDFFLKIPEQDRRELRTDSIHQQQCQQPLFEFSGACAGCGETPYLKLLSQLFGDRALVANATGCSSIYGGNLPTTPWSQNGEGRGPAWSNSLFEDNAEFGLGFRLSIDKQAQIAIELLEQLSDELGPGIVQETIAAAAEQRDEADIFAQRERVTLLKERIKKIKGAPALRLLGTIDCLVKKSVWIVGGDGWGYDIGYGGLDHVLASGHNVNVLILDTEVYSNTGGQMSKATPRGAVAKFAAGGKEAGKKDLGLIAMTYGHIYVASVAMGARDEHTLRAFLEAEAYDGPSLIIAYSHCIAHGINMTTAMKNQKAAVDSGQWQLYRYHPDRLAEGKNPLKLDSRSPRGSVTDYMYRENRFKMLLSSRPEEARRLAASAQEDVNARRALYEYLAAYHDNQTNGKAKPPEQSQVQESPSTTSQPE